MTTQLPWFPYDTAEWEIRTGPLTMEEEGALMRLCRRAWAEPVPCTLVDAPAMFERVLGAKWKRFLPLVRQHFTETVEDGRIRCAWLAELYLQQLAKHESASRKGKLGGRPKKGERKPGETSAFAQVAQDETNRESEGVSPAANAAGGDPPPPDGARAALPGSLAAGDDERGPVPTDGGPALTAADAKAIAMAGEVRDFPLAEYHARLEQRVATWAARNADRWQQMLADAREQAACEVSPDAPESMRERLVQSLARESARIERNWPTYEQYVAEQRAAQARDRRIGQNAAKLDLMRVDRKRPDEEAPAA